MPKLKLIFFCSSRIARMVSFALLKPFFTWRTSLCMSPTPSIETRVLKMTPFFSHSSATLVSIGIARCGVSPVVLMPNLRSRGSRFSITSHNSTRSLRVVGSPPETFAVSMFFHSPDENTRSISASDISCLRSARFQLWHISHCASHTQVQWKISTVGWMGRTRRHVRVDQIPGSAESGFCEVFGGVDLSH